MISRGSHLGALVADLADGQLSVGDTERALAHVDVCPACAADLEACRAARRAVAESADVVPDGALTARLLALAGTFPGPAPVRAVDRSGGDAWAQDRRVLIGEVAPRIVTRQRVAALGGIAAVAVISALFVLGAQPLISPSTHPGVAQRLLAEAPFELGPTAGSTAVVNASAELSGLTAPGDEDLVGDPIAQQSAVLGWLHANHWTCPDHLPEGWVVMDVRLRAADGAVLDSDRSVLELDLARGAQRIVLLEQRGRLDPSSLGDVTPQRRGEHSVYLLAGEPWHLIWESGSTVVTVVAEAPVEVVDDVVASFPPSVERTSVPVRISRGWAVATGAVR